MGREREERQRGKKGEEEEKKRESDLLGEIGCVAWEVAAGDLAMKGYPARCARATSAARATSTCDHGSCGPEAFDRATARSRGPTASHLAVALASPELSRAFDLPLSLVLL
jgi:hypothetical protein